MTLDGPDESFELDLSASNATSCEKAVGAHKDVDDEVVQVVSNPSAKRKAQSVSGSKSQMGAKGEAGQRSGKRRAIKAQENTVPDCGGLEQANEEQDIAVHCTRKRQRRSVSYRESDTAPGAVAARGQLQHCPATNVEPAQHANDDLEGEDVEIVAIPNKNKGKWHSMTTIEEKRQPESVPQSRNETEGRIMKTAQPRLVTKQRGATSSKPGRRSGTTYGTIGTEARDGKRQRDVGAQQADKISEEPIFPPSPVAFMPASPGENPSPKFIRRGKRVSKADPERKLKKTQYKDTGNEVKTTTGSKGTRAEEPPVITPSIAGTHAVLPSAPTSDAAVGDAVVSHAVDEAMIAAEVDADEAQQGDGALSKSKQPQKARKNITRENDSLASARDWLLAALGNPRGAQARQAILRPSLQSVVDFLVQNIDATIQAGHNNSVLVLGARGSGKSLAVERAIATIQSRWNSGRPAEDPLVGVVRLLGWAHSEERSAFREVARQLCACFSLQFTSTASFMENIEFLRTMLGGLARSHKVAVFLLEDFDGFARRPKQTLLYNLLDALATTGMQAVVIGTACRYDCVDQLEKRVKSRFSHRIVDLGLPRGVDCEGSVDEGPSTKEYASDGGIDVLRAMLTLPQGFPQKELAATHNAAVEMALNEPSATKAMAKYCGTLHSRGTLRHLGMLAETMLARAGAGATSSNKGLLPRDSVAKAVDLLVSMNEGGIKSYLVGLSVLELAMLIASYRASSNRGHDPINFEMAYKEFYAYTTSGDHVDNYTKGAASKAFERLASMGLLGPAGNYDVARRKGRRGQDHAPMLVQVSAFEIGEALQEHATCPPRMKDWLTREGAPLTTAVGLV